MAFAQEPIKTPTSIGRIEITLVSPAPGGVEQPHANYNIEVVYNTGEMRRLHGNLVPHLTQAQVNALLSFMADMRTKANAEILPE